MEIHEIHGIHVTPPHMQSLGHNPSDHELNHMVTAEVSGTDYLITGLIRCFFYCRIQCRITCRNHGSSWRHVFR